MNSPGRDWISLPQHSTSSCCNTAPVVSWGATTEYRAECISCGVHGLVNSTPSPVVVPTTKLLPLTRICGRWEDTKPWSDLGGVGADAVHQLGEQGGGVAQGGPAPGHPGLSVQEEEPLPHTVAGQGVAGALPGQQETTHLEHTSHSSYQTWSAVQSG